MAEPHHTSLMVYLFPFFPQQNIKNLRWKHVILKHIWLKEKDASQNYKRSFCNETLNKIPQLNTEERFTEPQFNQPRSSKNDPSKTILNAICEKCGNEDVCKNSKCELYRYMYYIFYNSKRVNHPPPRRCQLIYYYTLF